MHPSHCNNLESSELNFTTRSEGVSSKTSYAEKKTPDYSNLSTGLSSTTVHSSCEISWHHATPSCRKASNIASVFIGVVIAVPEASEQCFISSFSGFIRSKNRFCKNQRSTCELVTTPKQCQRLLRVLCQVHSRALRRISYLSLNCSALFLEHVVIPFVKVIVSTDAVRSCSRI